MDDDQMTRPTKDVATVSHEPGPGTPEVEESPPEPTLDERLAEEAGYGYGV
jgi:hypothetical protein